MEDKQLTARTTNEQEKERGKKTGKKVTTRRKNQYVQAFTVLT